MLIDCYELLYIHTLYTYIIYLHLKHISLIVIFTCKFPFRTPTKSPVKLSSSYRQKDSLSQLTQLVDRGERHGLFLDKMPGRIQQVVRDENLRFMHNKDIYNESYLQFILKLLVANIVSSVFTYLLFSTFNIKNILINMCL